MKRIFALSGVLLLVVFLVVGIVQYTSDCGMADRKDVRGIIDELDTLPASTCYDEYCKTELCKRVRCVDPGQLPALERLLEPSRFDLGGDGAYRRSLLAKILAIDCGSNVAMEILVTNLDPMRVSEDAVWTLRHIGARRSVPFLIRALETNTVTTENLTSFLSSITSAGVTRHPSFRKYVNPAEIARAREYWLQWWKENKHVYQ